MEKKEDIDKTTIKFLFLGDTSTGKTFLINSLFQLNSESKVILNTVGFETYIENYCIDISSDEKLEFKLKIIDTSGQERYRSLIYMLLKKNMTVFYWFIL